MNASKCQIKNVKIICFQSVIIALARNMYLSVVTWWRAICPIIVAYYVTERQSLFVLMTSGAKNSRFINKTAHEFVQCLSSAESAGGVYYRNRHFMKCLSTTRRITWNCVRLIKCPSVWNWISYVKNINSFYQVVHNLFVAGGFMRGKYLYLPPWAAKTATYLHLTAF